MSLELHADATCQPLPYKGLPPLQKEPRPKDLHLIFIEIETISVGVKIPVLIPKDRNVLHNEKQNGPGRRNTDLMSFYWIKVNPQEYLCFNNLKKSLYALS